MKSDREQRIREKAYEIWERDGRPDGRHAAHWEQAEREVSGDLLKRVPERQAPEHSGGVSSGLQSGATRPANDPAAGAGSAPGGIGSKNPSSS